MATGKKKATSETTKVEPATTDAGQESIMDQLERAGGQVHSLFSRLPALFRIARSDALQMQSEIDEGVRLRSPAYWILVILSIGIATPGLIINSPAVIIGAMLVSPLMSPIIGLGLSIAVSDFFLGLKSALVLAASILVAILTSFIITILIPINEVTPEILGRTNPTLIDLAIALFSGAVAAVSSVKSDGQEVLGKAGPGAAIGVALMPPLCVVGYGMGAGFNTAMMWGAFLLFITNMVAIVFVSSLFYYFIYVKYDIGKLVSLLSNRRHKRDPVYRNLSSFESWKKLTGNTGTWKRFLLPVSLLLLISYPLFISLRFLKIKSEIRFTITKYLSSLEDLNLIRGPDRLVFDRDEVGGNILYSSKESPGEKFQSDLNEMIEQRFSGYNSSISLVRIAGESDIDQLKRAQKENLQSAFDPATQRLNTALRNQHGAELVGELRKELAERFPENTGVLYKVYGVFHSSGIEEIHASYLGEEMSRESREILEGSLQQDLIHLDHTIPVKLKRDASHKGSALCTKTTYSEQDAIDEIQKLFQKIESSPHLILSVHIQPGLFNAILEKSKASRLADRIQIDPLLNEKEQCFVQYRYRLNHGGL